MNENTTDQQPDGAAAWSAMMDKLNPDERDCLKIGIQQQIKRAYTDGFSAGVKAEVGARKRRNAAKHERGLRRRNGNL